MSSTLAMELSTVLPNSLILAETVAIFASVAAVDPAHVIDVLEYILQNPEQPAASRMPRMPNRTVKSPAVP